MYVGYFPYRMPLSYAASPSAMRSPITIVWVLHTLWQTDAMIMPLCVRQSRFGICICGSPNWCNYRTEQSRNWNWNRFWMDDWHVPRSYVVWYRITGGWALHWWGYFWLYLVGAVGCIKAFKLKGVYLNRLICEPFNFATCNWIGWEDGCTDKNSI